MASVCVPLLETAKLGFPGGAVVENLPANAGNTGSSPGLGRSHMPRSNQAREPQLLSLHVWSLCSATREAAIVRGPRTTTKSGPHLPQLEKALAQKRRPNTAKNKINKNKFRNCQTVFQSDYTFFHSLQQRLRVPVASHPQQHLVLYFKFQPF